MGYPGIWILQQQLADVLMKFTITFEGFIAGSAKLSFLNKLALLRADTFPGFVVTNLEEVAATLAILL